MNVDDVKLNFDDNGIFLVNAILAVVMFGVALDLKLRDFTAIAKKPKAPLVGLTAQLLLLPAITYVLVLIMKPAPSIALGMILVAACPSGNMSNFLTHLARGNTALSVSVTAASTVAALVCTPLNFSFWAGLNPDTRAVINELNVSPFEVMSTVLFVLGIPLMAGMTFARALPNVTQRLHKPLRYFSLGAFVLFLVLAFAKNFDVFVQNGGPILVVVVIHNATALCIGYFSAKAVRLSERDCRAVSIEVGIQNSALALALIFQYFDGLGGMALVAGMWGIWHCVSGLTIATIWNRRPYAPADLPPLETEEA
jgi:BASS family bile acid:Na+ symporter